jgi:hypothetical protein
MRTAISSVCLYAEISADPALQELSKLSGVQFHFRRGEALTGGAQEEDDERDEE